MQFLAKSLSKSIRPSTARQSWILSQQSPYSNRTVKSEKTESVTPNTSEWPRPTEVPYQQEMENSVNFIGYVNKPVEFNAQLDGKSLAGTVISQASGDSPTNSGVPITFEGDLAHIAKCHLKKGELVQINGKFSPDFIPSGVNNGQANVRVLVSNFRYILGSKAPHQVLPELEFEAPHPILPEPDFEAPHQVLPPSKLEEGMLNHTATVQKTSDSGTDPWSSLLDKPSDWRDYRERKQNGSVNPKYPDFKKKDGSVSLWLNRAPSHVLSNLKDLKFGATFTPTYVKQENATVEKTSDSGTDPWSSLLDKPSDWRDYRERKQNGSVNPKYPDFKKKDGSVSLWLDRAPSHVLSNLKDLKFDDTPFTPTYVKQEKAGDESWKDLVQNKQNWWDNRVDKKNPKGPDFVHKQTRAALWLSTCPSSLLTDLPPPKSE